MAETGASTVATAMEGKGGYNRNSRVQAVALTPAVLMLERAARVVTLPPDSEPIVIADYGSSQGRNSLVPLQTAIRALRERVGQNREISVIHTDLPENDFTVLFNTLLTSPESYLRKDGAVFASAVGRSYYEQILPTHSVSLGWSFWAVQWLSRTPASIPDQVQVAFSQDAPTRAAFAQQAAEDWQRFLAMRERELSPGAGSWFWQWRSMTTGISATVRWWTRCTRHSWKWWLVDSSPRKSYNKWPFRPLGEVERISWPHLEPAGVSTGYALKKSKSFLARTTSGRTLNSTGTRWCSPLNGRHSRALRSFRLSPAAWMAAEPPHVQVIL